MVLVQNADRSRIPGVVSVQQFLDLSLIFLYRSVKIVGLELHCAAPASVIEAEVSRCGRLRCEIASRGHDGGADDLELGVVQPHLPGAVQKDSEGDATRRFRDVARSST